MGFNEWGEEVLKEMLEEETGEDYAHLDENSNLTEGLGLDSVDFVSLILLVDNRFNIKLETAALQQVKLVSDLLDLIQKQLPNDTPSAVA